MARKSAFARRLLSGTVMLAAASPIIVGMAYGQSAADPGVRGGTPGAGCFLPGLASVEKEFFFAGGFTFLRNSAERFPVKKEDGSTLSRRTALL